MTDDEFDRAITDIERTIRWVRIGTAVVGLHAVILGIVLGRLIWDLLA